MALLKDYHNEQFDVIIPNCYWKIELENGIRGGKTKIEVRMSCYKTKELADANSNRFSGFGFSFTPDLASTSNFLAQAYSYAKTLPELLNAVDA